MPTLLLEPKSRLALAKEYAFNAVVTAFLRALRAGVINIRHATVLLAYYARLGPSFDLSTRFMVEILKEEGMYKSNGALVADVIVGALKEVSSNSLHASIRAYGLMMGLSSPLRIFSIDLSPTTLIRSHLRSRLYPLSLSVAHNLQSSNVYHLNTSSLFRLD